MKKYLLFSLILLASCGKFSKRLNQQIDTDRGKNLGEKFYGYVKARQWTSADALCGGTIKQGELADLLKGLDSVRGEFQNASFMSSSSDVTERGDSISGEIDIAYNITYQNMKKDEQLVMKYIKDSLTIVGYHSVNPGEPFSK